MNAAVGAGSARTMFFGAWVERRDRCAMIEVRPQGYNYRGPVRA